MQNGLGFSPLQSGLAVVPLALAFTAAAHLAGRWVVTAGIRVLLIGCAIQLIGLAALFPVAALLPHPGLATVLLVLPVFGLGQGLVMAPLAGTVLGRIDAAHAGSGAGMLNTTQQGAGAAGVAAVGAIYLLCGVPAALGLLAISVLATAGLLGWMARTR